MDLWKLYEDIRKEKIRQENSSNPDFACNLTPIKRKNTLQELDELSKKYIFSIENPDHRDVHTNSCCRCIII